MNASLIPSILRMRARVNCLEGIFVCRERLIGSLEDLFHSRDRIFSCRDESFVSLDCDNPSLDCDIDSLEDLFKLRERLFSCREHLFDCRERLFHCRERLLHSLDCGTLSRDCDFISMRGFFAMWGKSTFTGKTLSNFVLIPPVWYNAAPEGEATMARSRPGKRANGGANLGFEATLRAAAEEQHAKLITLNDAR